MWKKGHFPFKWSYVEFKFIQLNFSDMANIQNGFNTWYIASIQTLSSQYWNKSFFNVESKNKNRKFWSSCVSLHTKISISIKDSWKLDGYMGILSVTHSNKNTFWKVVPYLPVKNILFEILWTIQLWDRELKRFSARKWQNLHNSPLSLSNSRLHENCVSQYYTRIAHFSLSFGGKMGQ